MPFAGVWQLQAPRSPSLPPPSRNRQRKANLLSRPPSGQRPPGDALSGPLSCRVTCLAGSDYERLGRGGTARARLAGLRALSLQPHFACHLRRNFTGGKLKIFLQSRKCLFICFTSIIGAKVCEREVSRPRRPINPDHSTLRKEKNPTKRKFVKLHYSASQSPPKPPLRFPTCHKFTLSPDKHTKNISTTVSYLSPGRSHAACWP